MRTISLHYPGKLVFGSEALRSFTDDFISTGHKKLYILTVPFVLDQLQEMLRAFADASIQTEIDTSIVNEPTFHEFETILDKAKMFGCDSVAGIGGGSVLDTAKLIAAQLKNTQPLEEIIGIGNLKERQTYLACLPTTSGTGSEVSPNAIFVDENGDKKGVISPYLVPDGAYVCPELTLSVPPSVTAATGIDALTHCIEAFANRFAHPMVDVFALEGIRLIYNNLRNAYKNGNDIEARTQVALGSVYGGMCLGPVNTGAVHALSYPLGTTFHIPHGLSNAVLLPYVMEFNLPYAVKKYAEMALAIGATPGENDEETAKKGIEMIRQLNKDCGIPSKLSELDIPEQAIAGMAENAIQIQRLLKNNPREVKLEDAVAIYKSAFKG